MDRHQIIRPTERRHFGDGAGQSAARGHGKVIRIHAAHFASKPHAVNHAAVHHRRLLRALACDRCHPRRLRIQRNRSRRRQFQHIRIRPASRRHLGRARARIEIHHTAKVAGHVHVAHPVDDQALHPLVRRSTHYLRPRVRTSGRQLEDKRLLPDFRRHMALHARARIEIDCSGKRSAHIDATLVIERHRVDFIEAGSAQALAPRVPAVAVETQNKSVALTRRVEEAYAHSVIKIHGATERAHQRQFALAAHRHTAAQHAADDAVPALRPRHVPLRVQFAQRRLHADLRHQPGIPQRGGKGRRRRQRRHQRVNIAHGIQAQAARERHPVPSCRHLRLRPHQFPVPGKLRHKSVRQPARHQRGHPCAGVEVHLASEKSAHIHLARRVHGHGCRLFMRGSTQGLRPEQVPIRIQF